MKIHEISTSWDAEMLERELDHVICMNCPLDPDPPDMAFQYMFRPALKASNMGTAVKVA